MGPFTWTSITPPAAPTVKKQGFTLQTSAQVLQNAYLSSQIMAAMQREVDLLERLRQQEQLARESWARLQSEQAQAYFYGTSRNSGRAGVWDTWGASTAPWDTTPTASSTGPELEKYLQGLDAVAEGLLSSKNTSKPYWASDAVRKKTGKRATARLARRLMRTSPDSPEAKS